MQILCLVAFAVLLLLVAVIAMAFRVLFVKDGKFPEGHAHDIAKHNKKNNH